MKKSIMPIEPEFMPAHQPYSIQQLWSEMLRDALMEIEDERALKAYSRFLNGADTPIFGEEERFKKWLLKQQQKFNQQLQARIENIATLAG